MKYFIVNIFDDNLLLNESKKEYSQEDATEMYQNLVSNGIKCQLLSFSAETGIQQIDISI